MYDELKWKLEKSILFVLGSLVVASGILLAFGCCPATSQLQTSVPPANPTFVVVVNESDAVDQIALERALYLVRQDLRAVEVIQDYYVPAEIPWGTYYVKLTDVHPENLPFTCGYAWWWKRYAEVYPTCGSCPVGDHSLFLANVIGHEVGHLFGLGHSSHPLDIMYEGASCPFSFIYDQTFTGGPYNLLVKDAE